MSWIIAETEETHEWVPGTSETLGFYPGTIMPFGFASSGHWRPRTTEEVALLRAEKEREREDAVLLEAEQIKARRLFQDA